MSEHDHMSSQLHEEVQRRLAEGRPVGRLINSLQNRSQSTAGYQSLRSASDIAGHARWKGYRGSLAPQEPQELERRARGESQGSAVFTNREHDHLTNNEVHTEIERRLEEGEPVGRLINTLQSRGESTKQYQSRRTPGDVAAHIRWLRSQSGAEPDLEWRAQRERPSEMSCATKPKPWWKSW